MKNTPQHYILDSLRKFSGIPYEKMDCYELVKYFYEDIFGIQLSNLYGTIRPTKKQTELLVDQEMNKFKEVTKPRFGDIILFNIVGLTCHIGIYIDETHFLHSRDGVGSAFERYDRWQKRIKGYYRCLKK